MSLYNLLHGRNPLAPVFLGWLGLGQEDTGRFRDAFISKADDGALAISIFTRNGGGNREDYEDVTLALRAHPQFLRDYDDDFDCTYATYEFSVPVRWQAAATDLVSDRTPMEKMTNLIAKLRDGSARDDPEVRAAVEKMRPTIEAIAAFVDNSSLSGGAPHTPPEASEL